jgi:hypothetical protein
MLCLSIQKTARALNLPVQRKRQKRKASDIEQVKNNGFLTGTFLRKIKQVFQHLVLRKLIKLRISLVLLDSSVRMQEKRKPDETIRLR